MSNCVLRFDNHTRSFYDDCYRTTQEKSSQQAGNYSFIPPITSNPNQANNLALSQPNININNGSGWMGHKASNIDTDSSFRNAKNLTNTKEIHQLNREQYFSVPYLARGPGNPCIESILRPVRRCRAKKTV